MATDVATGAEVDDLLAEMKVAMAEDRTWSGSPFFLDVFMRTPG